MNFRKLAAIYATIVLIALVMGLIGALFLQVNPTNNTPTPVTERSQNARTSASISNYTASNANVVNGAQGHPSNANATPPIYPTLPPVTPLSQTVDGFTVTLYPMYADANRIVLSYTVQSSYDDPSQVFGCVPSPRQIPPCFVSTRVAEGLPPNTEDFKPQLTGDNGRVFPWSAGSVWQDSSMPRGSLLIFDAQQPPESLPAELHLHLTMNKAHTLIQIPGDAAISWDVKGPFIFDFSLPLDPVRSVAELNQTVTSPGGHKITVERVIATRHDVRVVWRWQVSTQPQPTPSMGMPVGAPYGRYLCCYLKLEVGGKSATFSRTPGLPASKTDIVDVSVLDERGEWTISTWYASTWTGDSFDPDWPGPVFHFTMPAPTNSLQP
jgi:hypothetical protein